MILKMLQLVTFRCLENFAGEEEDEVVGKLVEVFGYGSFNSFEKCNRPLRRWRRGRISLQYTSPTSQPTPPCTSDPAPWWPEAIKAMRCKVAAADQG